MAPADDDFDGALAARVEAFVRNIGRRTGRDGIDHPGFYRAFALFRLAAIYHGIRARAMRGTAASAHAAEFAAHYPLLARLGWAQTAQA